LRGRDQAADDRRDAIQAGPARHRGFAPLAAQAGFRIAKVDSARLSDQVLLRPD
jgi:hypothetical protein